MNKYQYDAWGNITYQYGSMANINPFRYRGYYYDTETGFYYLQTRYYDPSIMRFINADNYELVSQLAGSKELNMYAYCRNNPIMLTDPTGEGWILALILIGSAVAGGILNGIESYEKGNRGGDLVLDVFIGASAGLATAGFVMSIGAVGYIGFMGASASAVQFGALGFASFNLGSFTLGALLGIEAPEPIEMPTRPTPPIYFTPITGY